MAGGSFNFRELQKLQKQLEKLQREQETFIQECAKELAARFLQKVVKRTPVGRAPKLNGPQTVKVKVRGADGKIRTRSYLSKTGEIYQKYWSGYQGGNLRRSWTVGEIQKEGSLYKVEVINDASSNNSTLVGNNSSYASYVEFGHRQKPGRYVPALGKRLKSGWVPGQFMMTISEEELKAQAPAILRKKIEEKLREGFG
ncbi:MAG: HK97 gp10 family phage protein [bacterium]|nr:HK97 gp10 family phage protein [bacterium]